MYMSDITGKAIYNNTFKQHPIIVNNSPPEKTRNSDQTLHLLNSSSFLPKAS